MIPPRWLERQFTARPLRLINRNPSITCPSEAGGAAAPCRGLQEATMTTKVLVLVGTKKGAFILESDRERQSWQQRGPYCQTWPMNHVVADRSTGTIYAGGGNEWFGPAVWKSTDLGATWTHSSRGLAYAAGEQPIKSVWSLAERRGQLYAGVEPAGLFRIRRTTGRSGSASRPAASSIRRTGARPGRPATAARGPISSPRGKIIRST